MRSKALLLALVVVVACGAGPFRGSVVGNFPGSAAGPATSAPIVNAAAPAAAYALRAPEFAQVAFKGPKGLTINYDVSALGAFDSAPIVCEDPGKPQAKKPNFQTARSYRLKLTNVPNSQLALYPTSTTTRFRSNSRSRILKAFRRATSLRKSSSFPRSSIRISLWPAARARL